MQKYLLAIFFSIAFLEARDLLEFGVGGGYRKDHVNSNPYSYHDKNGVEIEGFVNFLFEDIYLSTMGDYAWISSDSHAADCYLTAGYQFWLLKKMGGGKNQLPPGRGLCMAFSLLQSS